MNNHVFRLQCNDVCPSLNEIRDDPEYGVSQKVRDWIDFIMHDSEAYDRFFEGSVDGNNEELWCEDPHGIISVLSIPHRKCPECKQYLPSEERFLDLICPGKVHHLIDVYFEETSEYSLERLLQLIKDIESVLRTDGMEMSLQPGDVFSPVIWKDPILIKREVPLLGGFNLILNERLSERFISAHFPRVKFYPLQVKSRFYPECQDHFFWFLASMDTWDSDFIWKEQGFPWHICKSCGRTSFDSEDENMEQRIKSRRMYSAWRKKKVLPRRYVPDTMWFFTEVYEGLQQIFLKPEAMALLYDVDLSFAKITKIDIID